MINLNELSKEELIIKITNMHRIANNSLYFDDSSDYCGDLWDVIREVNDGIEELEYIRGVEL